MASSNHPRPTQSTWKRLPNEDRPPSQQFAHVDLSPQLSGYRELVRLGLILGATTLPLAFLNSWLQRRRAKQAKRQAQDMIEEAVSRGFKQAVLDPNLAIALQRSGRYNPLERSSPIKDK